nr:unnamed protein product [Callosobruchus chinensis]
MSFEYYTKWWIASKKQLEDLYSRDAQWRKKAKPITDRNLANMLLGGLYAKMWEFNQELRKIDLSEYHYIDGSLIELKLVPYDVEILHPALMFPRAIDVEDMVQTINKGEKIFIPPEPVVETEPLEGGENMEGAEKLPELTPEDIKAQEEAAKKADRKPKPKKLIEEVELTPEEIEARKRKDKITESITLIQTAERARQERIYFDIKEAIFKRKQAMKMLPPSQKKHQGGDESSILDEPSLKLQSWWRGCSDRIKMKAKEVKRRMLIGMYEPSWKSTEAYDIFQKNLEVRRAYRDERIKDYIKSIDDEKARILRVVAPGLMEDVGDEIREWFRVWYKEIRMFDKFPPEEKGGTILVVRGETMTPKEYLDDYEKKRREKVKNKGKDKAKIEAEKKKKAEAEKKKKEAERKKKEAEAAKKKKKKKKPSEYEFEYEETAGLPFYKEGMKEHVEIWDQRNDFDNPLEKHYMDMITDRKCYEVQIEVRQKIDEAMRIELEMLEDALEEDRIRMGKKKKKKKGKKGKGKKKKKGKKGKKDPTGDRTTEDLFQELVNQGIIRTYPKASLSDYHGDFSYKNWELRNEDFDPPATLLDVRQAVIMNCIIPLGVTTMQRPRSVLIAGPRQSGKHLLANAIFNETKCVLFDLSPERTAGKYPGAKGMKMFMHLISKMSKVLAPSVIYFDAAEKIFYKKVPKEEKELDPKRVGKKLFKGVIKTIGKDDRVLVLGITGKPWAAQAAKLKKTFERHILIPRPDYNSIYLYWRELLMPYHGVDRNFNVTALTKVTVNYPFPVLKQALEEVLVPRRIVQLRFKPLTCEEIYEVFVSKGIEPISDKEYKKFIKYYQKTPLGKEKKAFNKWADLKREQEAKAKEKQNKKNFERHILIPRPDYNSIYLYWRELLMPYHGVDRNFNVTALTKVTVNYPFPVLKQALEEVLVPRRIVQLRFKPLTCEEIYEVFVSKGIEPISDKEYKKFIKYYQKTPLGKEKKAFNKWADLKREQEAKAKEKQNKKK